MSQHSDELSVTVGFIGCGSKLFTNAVPVGTDTKMTGKFGSAVFRGLLDAGYDPTSQNTSLRKSAWIPQLKRIIVFVKTPETDSRVRRMVVSYETSVQVDVYTHLEAEKLREADLIFLCCRRGDLPVILAQSDICKVLRARLVVSGIAGLPASQLVARLDQGAGGVKKLDERFATRIFDSGVVQIMPNVAAMAQMSATVGSLGDSVLPEETKTIIEWMFTRIGSFQWVESDQFDLAVTMCSSGPAFVASFLDALVDGAVLCGLNREQATTMAANTAMSAASLLLQGESASDIKTMVSTPGGPTAVGLLTMDERGVRPLGVHTIRSAWEKLRDLARSVTT